MTCASSYIVKNTVPKSQLWCCQSRTANHAWGDREAEERTGEECFSFLSRGTGQLPGSGKMASDLSSLGEFLASCLLRSHDFFSDLVRLLWAFLHTVQQLERGKKHLPGKNETQPSTPILHPGVWCKGKAFLSLSSRWFLYVTHRDHWNRPSSQESDLS